MKTLLHAAAPAMLLALSIVPLGAGSVPSRPTTLIVFAAASLREAFTEIGDRLRADGAVAARFDFGGSDRLAAQIALGAPADVFASADAVAMNVARRHGAIQGVPATFARNRLVIAVPIGNPARVASARDLARPGIRLVIAAPTVPAGRYARRAFAAMAHDKAFGAGYERRVLANVMSEETDVKAVAAKIALGEAEAGVVYATDVAPLRTRMHAIPIDARYSGEPTYVIAIVRGTEHSRAAHRFVDAVSAPDGRAVLARHGFLPAPR